MHTYTVISPDIESKVGRRLILEYLVSLDYRPLDVAKSHDDLAVAVQRSSSNIGHVA